MATEIKKNDATQEKEDGVIVIKLRKQLDYNGHIYEEITLDLDSLTGSDSLAVENELVQRKKGVVIQGWMNNDYIIGIAAKACREPIGSDAFLQMSLKDYTRVKDAVRNFLLK